MSEQSVVAQLCDPSAAGPGTETGGCLSSQLGEMVAVRFSERLPQCFFQIWYVQGMMRVTKADKMWSFNLTEG